MLTCWSDSARVMSDSSRLRSSASTWMATRNELFAVGAQETATSRSALGPQVGGVDAVGPVHRDAGAAGDEAEDLVAGHRRTALGQLDQQVGGARPTSMPVSEADDPAPPTGDDLVLAGLVGGGVLAALDGDQPVDHRLGADGALAHRRVQGGHVGQLEVAGHRGQVLAA